MELIYSNSIGFCSGVKRAFSILDEAIEYSRLKNVLVYLYGDIVHNERAVLEVKKRGVIKIESADDFKPGSILVIRAHGISSRHLSEFKKKNAIVFDATCPIVKKSYELLSNAKNSKAILGKRDHDEVKELKDEFPDAYIAGSVDDLKTLKSGVYDAVLQTTLSRETLSRVTFFLESADIKMNFLNSICYETAKRLDSLLCLSDKSDALLVIGDKKSSNTKMLFDRAKSLGLPAYFAEDIRDVLGYLSQYERVGVISGTSTPESLYLI